MRRRRRGRPHLLCPPCPPIGQSGGQEAETSPGAETRPGVERCGSRRRKAARKQSSRCAGRRSSSSCQSRAPKCHGRPAPALRALSGTEEFGHRSARGTRSQDRCRQAVLGHGSRHSAKPVSSVRVRGSSAVQSHRLCIPRICFDQSYREPKQRGRHCVAHILGGVRPVRASRILQRSTPVLVPFLLRGQVRLPVVLHGSRPLERGSYAVSSHHTSSVSKASRGRGQHRERHQRAGPGRGSRNDEGRRESKHDPASEGQVKPPASPNADTPDHETEDVPQRKSSVDSSTDSPAEPTTSPSFPARPALRSSTSLGQAQPQAVAATTAAGTQLPGKPRGGLRSRANSSSQPQAPGQQRARPSTTSSGPSQGPSGPTHRPSTTSSQGPTLGQSPSGTTTRTQPPNNTPNGPDASAPKSSRRHQKRPTTKATSSTSVPELPASCQPESSPEYSSESTTEVTYSWPDYRHRLRCLQHCWRMKHLAC